MKLSKYLRLICSVSFIGLMSINLSLVGNFFNKSEQDNNLFDFKYLEQYETINKQICVSNKSKIVNNDSNSNYHLNEISKSINNRHESIGLYALYDTGYYTSYLVDNLLNYRDTFASETAKQLKIPSSLVNSLTNGITFDMSSSFVMPSKDQINSSILNSTDGSDLKKFVTLLDKYRTALTTWNPNPTEANEQAMLAAKKDLDNLGYYYLTVYSSIPIDYYLTRDSYNELQEDKTFVEIGKSAGYYGYYVKYAATNKPLNIDNLSNYLNITKSINTDTSNSDINEIQTVNDVKTKLDSLNIQLEDTTSKLNSLLQTSTTLQNDIDTLNKQIDSLLSDLVNDNPELSQAAEKVDAKYQTQINTIAQNIDIKKQEFEQDKDFKGSGFIKHLNKTLDYTDELKNLTNLYENKLNDLGTLFTNSEPVIKVQKQVQNLTANVLTRVNNVTSEINSITKELNSLNDLNTTLTSQLASINKLTYTTTTKNTTKITVNFALQAMQTAASLSNSMNSEITSYYSLLSENKLSDYFYVTKDQFAAKLNEIIKTQLGIDPQITSDVIKYTGEDITVGTNNYKYTFTKSADTLNTLAFNVELNEIKSTINEVNVNNPKVKGSDLVLNSASLNNNSNDATALLANIATFKTTLQKNQTNILNSVNQLSNSLIELNKKTDDLNKYSNIAFLYPQYIETQYTLNEIKDELVNYKPTIVSLTQLNSTLIWIVTAISIIVLLVLIVVICIKRNINKKKIFIK